MNLRKTGKLAYALLLCLLSAICVFASACNVAEAHKAIGMNVEFTQGEEVILETDSLEVLRPMLVVTQKNANGEEEPTQRYTIKGSFNIPDGPSTAECVITITLQADKSISQTIVVVVTQTGHIHTLSAQIVITKPGCESVGKAEKICIECKEVLQYELPAVGHEYGEPAYSWAEDHSKCTAVVGCVNCDHEETAETSNVSVVETATCVNNGLYVYTATFENADLFGTAITTKVQCLWAWEILKKLLKLSSSLSNATQITTKLI